MFKKRIAALLLLVSIPLLSFAMTTVLPFAPVNAKWYIIGTVFLGNEVFDTNPHTNGVAARYAVHAGGILSDKAILDNRIFAMFNMIAFFGGSRPALHQYNFKLDPIMTKIAYGVGFRITHHLQIKVNAGRNLDMGGMFNSGEKQVWFGYSIRYEIPNLTMGNFHISSYQEFYFFPYHNEFDPSPYRFPFAQRIVGRYALDIATRITNSTIFENKLYVFFDSFNVLGNTAPQTRYNHQANPVVMIFSSGVGYRIARLVSVELAYGQNFDLGNYHNTAARRWIGLSLNVQEPF